MPDGKPDFSWLGTKPPPSMQKVEGIGGTQQQYTPGEFDFTPKYNMDNYKFRAQNQRWYEQLGLTLGNLIPNIATGLGEAVGYIPELWDQDRDYTNALTQKMQEWKNPLGEVYREDPNEVWDMGDSAWWFNNFGQLAESAATFAVQGAGFAKLFGGMAKGAAAIAGGTARARSIASGTAQVLSAAALARQEGAMSGAQVYEKTYQNRMLEYRRRGMAPYEATELAKEDAAEAAAATVKMNTMMNTVMNLGVISPLFKNPSDKVLDWWKTTGKQEAGESFADYAKRIKSVKGSDPDIAKFLNYRSPFNSLPAEMFKEGVEELNTQYAESVGTEIGEGKRKGIGSALLDFSSYMDAVTNEEGALNFALGILGGGAQTVLIDAIPRYHQKTDADGNIVYKKATDGSFVTENGKRVVEKQLMRPKTHDQNGVRRYFKNVQDVILNDVQRIDQLQQRLVDAAADGNEMAAELARMNLFAVGALDAVRKGLGDNWSQQFEDIGAIDNTIDLGEQLQPQIDEVTEQLKQEPTPELQQQLNSLLQQQEALAGKTEAIRLGLTDSKENNEYKERAKESVQDLKHLSNLHAQIQKRFTHEDAIGADVADHLYFRHANLYLTNKAIEREEKALLRMEEMSKPLATSGNIIQQEVDRYNSELESWNKTIDVLNADIKALQTADKNGDIKTLSGLIEKYRGKAFSDGSLAEAVDDLIDKIRSKQAEYKESLDGAEELLKNSSGYTAWEKNNPGKSLDEYLSLSGKNTLVQQKRNNLEAAKAQRDITAQNLREMESEKNIDKLYAALQTDQKKTIEAITKRTKNANTEAFLLEANEKAAASLSSQQKESLAAKLKIQKAELEKQLNAAVKHKNNLQKEISETKGYRFDKSIKLKSELSKAVAEVSYLRDRLNEVNRQLDLLNIDVQHVNQTEAVVSSKTAEDISQEKKAVEEEIPALQVIPMVAEVPVEEKAIAQTEREQNALDTYLDFVNKFDSAVQQAFENLINQFSSGEALSFTQIIKTLQPYVRKRLLIDKDVTDSWQVIKNLVEELKLTEDEEVDESEVSEEDQQKAAEEVVVPQLEESNQPSITVYANSFTQEGIEEKYWEDAAKTTNAVKAVSSDFKYSVHHDGNTLRITSVTERDSEGIWAPQLDDSVNTDRLLPGVINPADEVVVEIDPLWDGVNPFTDYVGTDGNIRTDDAFKYVGYANVPVKITHKKTGKVIGYLPTNNWINETSDAGNYRNVADADVVDQSKINLEIRKNLAEKWNADKSSKTTTRISLRTPGQILYSGVVKDDGKTDWRVEPATQMLPDSSLQLAVSTQNGLMSGKGVKASSHLSIVRNPMGQEYFTERGTINVLLPMPNGQYKPSNLKVEKLGRKSDITTVTKVIELNLRFGTKHFTEKDQKTVDKIEDTTGFDITSAQGLKDFVEQYFTYTTGFGDIHLSADAPADVNNQKISRWLLSIPVNAPKLIKVGMTYSGQPEVKARLIQGQLDPEFIQAMTSGLEQRYRIVNFTDGNLRGINSKGEFKSVRISTDGKVSVKKYDDYNSYVKSFTATPVYGKTQVKGKYVYAANSQILLDMVPLVAPPDTHPVTPTAPIGVGPTDEVDEALKGMFGGTFDSIRVYSKPVIQSEGGMQVTLDNLQELSNFTPADTHNGKSVQEVFERLTSLNIGVIAEAYNPFVKC